MELEKALTAAGFTHDDELKDAHVTRADENGMHDSGPYVVHGVWKRGEVTVLVEQNTAKEDIGGMRAAVDHPAVCLITGPKGRIAANPEDVELVLAVAEDLT